MIITLNNWLEQNKCKLPLYFPTDGLILSAIGARTCYSDLSPIDLLIQDERICNTVERLEFLKRLAKARHYSVFAHSPVIFSDDNEHNMYKLWKYKLDDNRWTYCANVRHYMEISNIDYESYLANALTRYDKDGYITCIIYDGSVTIYDGLDVKKITTSEHYETIKNEPYLIAFIDIRSEWQWMSCIAHGFSVVYSHQHVRHTWQNFSQRSHRYTQVDNIIEPPSIEHSPPSIRMKFWSALDKCINTYNFLIDEGISKDDARFIAPSGRATTLMFSGPRFVMEDFVNKRLNKRTSWEIRKVAEFVNVAISYVDYHSGKVNVSCTLK